MNVIFVLILLVIIVVALIFLGWSCYNWINAYKTADIRMSFGKFRRIYELAPSKWENDFDYICRRVEWCSSYENGKGFCGTYISTSIAMKTLFGGFFFGKMKLIGKGSEKNGLRMRKLPLKI